MYRKNAATLSRDAQFVRACAVETHMHKSQKQFYASIYRQNAGEQARATDFVPACAVKMHVTTAIYAKICRKNAVPQSRDAHFDTLFDPAQSKRTWTKSQAIYRKDAALQGRGANFARGLRHGAQEPFYVRIYRENAGGQTEHPYLTPAFYLQPLSVDTFGEQKALCLLVGFLEYQNKPSPAQFRQGQVHPITSVCRCQLGHPS